MKILLGVSEYPPEVIGGGGQIFEQLAKGYQRAGHQVVVVSGHYSDSKWSQGVKVETEKGIKIYRLAEIGYHGHSAWRTRMPLTPSAWSRVREIIVSEKPDVAHLHGFGFWSIDMIAWWLRRYKIPYLLTVHGWNRQHLSYPFWSRLILSWYFNFSAEATLGGSQKLSTVSQHLMTLLPKSLRSKTMVIYNGFDYQAFSRPVKSARSKLKSKTILSLGRISKLKGYQEIVKLLPKLGKDYLYLIAGEDEGYQVELTLLAKKLGVLGQIRWLGQLDYETKRAMIKAANIVAIPSFAEGFGLVSLEAAAFGKLILYGNSEAVEEILADYPKKLLISQVNKRRLGQMMQVRAKFDFSPFSWTKITKQYLTVLESLQ